MRLAPHVPSQAPLRPPDSALRFSLARLRPDGGCSALSLLASPSPERAVPFRRKGTAGLTARNDVRGASTAKPQLQGVGQNAGMVVTVPGHVPALPLTRGCPVHRSADLQQL